MRYSKSQFNNHSFFQKYSQFPLCASSLQHEIFHLTLTLISKSFLLRIHYLSRLHPFFLVNLKLNNTFLTWSILITCWCSKYSTIKIVVESNFLYVRMPLRVSLHINEILHILWDPMLNQNLLSWSLKQMSLINTY